MRIKNLKNLDLLVVIIIALLNLLLALRQEYIPIIRLVLAFPLIFLLPGYTFVEVLFHRRPVDGVRRLLLSLGLSIALDILSGLIINIFPIGLTRLSWAFYLSSLVIVLSLVALCLRGKNSLNGLWLSQIRLDVRKHLVGELFICAALGIVIFSFIFSDYSALDQHRKGFTQLWMVQAEKPGQSCSVLVGVDSFEFKQMNYHLIMTINNAQSMLLPLVVLSPQKTWKIVVPINPPVNSSVIVEARLYRADEPAHAYRDVHLTMQLLVSDKIGSEAQCTT
jgi:uncharacterized membrane protein